MKSREILKNCEKSIDAMKNIAIMDLPYKEGMMKYNVKEAAQRLGVTSRCVYTWIEKGQFIGPFFDNKSQIEGKILNKMAKEYVRNKP